MLSYQHAYHAGQAADVVKHLLWAELLTALAAKPKPLMVYETHAGRGLYPLDAPETRKTAEYLTGLARLFPFPAALGGTAYARLTAALNPGGSLSLIPGSPWLAARAPLPPGSAVHLCEAHAGERAHLLHALRGMGHVHVHGADGHVHVPALVRAGARNAVLIDPSYEVKDEYLRTVATVGKILAHAPQTVVMVWYPLLPARRHQALIEGLKALSVPATWLAHVAWNPADAPGMYGSGQVVLNLPYRVEQTLEPLLKTLTPLLARGTQGLTATWLAPRR